MNPQYKKGVPELCVVAAALVFFGGINAAAYQRISGGSAIRKDGASS